MNHKIFNKLADVFFFQITIIEDLEFEGVIYKNAKKVISLSCENWEQYKETFFTQSMEKYAGGYSLAEKLEIELSKLENLPINETGTKILKNRYKAYLEQKQALPPQPISINESRTKKVIFETLANIDKQGWQYAFVSEQDYNLFTDLLTNFFVYNDYTLPETTIQLKRTCKTKVAKALGEIHKELSNENKLSTDTDYFTIIRVLSHFKDEKEGDLYKALTR